MSPARPGVILSTWKGPGPWNPGGKSPRKHVFKLRRPVETNKRVAAGIVTCMQQEKSGRAKVKSVKWHWQPNQPRTCTITPHLPVLSSRSPVIFVLRPIKRAQCRPFGSHHTVVGNSRAQWGERVCVKKRERQSDSVTVIITYIHMRPDLSDGMCSRQMSRKR